MSSRRGNSSSAQWTLAMRADSKETGGIWQANAALQQAAYGNTTEARHSAAEALKLAPASPGVQSEAALAFALAGDTARAESVAQDLGRRFPLDTQMQSLWLPAIRAQLALDRKEPGFRPECPASAPPIELGQILFVNNISCLYRCVCTRSGILRSRAGQCCRRRVSEDSRPQRHRLELLDRSFSTSGGGSCQRLTVENSRARMPTSLASGRSCLQRFPHALERG